MYLSGTSLVECDVVVFFFNLRRTLLTEEVLNGKKLMRSLPCLLYFKRRGCVMIYYVVLKNITYEGN